MLLLRSFALRHVRPFSLSLPRAGTQTARANWYSGPLRSACARLLDPPSPISPSSSRACNSTHFPPTRTPPHGRPCDIPAAVCAPRCTQRECGDGDGGVAPVHTVPIPHLSPPPCCGSSADIGRLRRRGTAIVPHIFFMCIYAPAPPWIWNTSGKLLAYLYPR